MKIRHYPLAQLEYDDVRNILFFKVKQDQEVDVAQISEMIQYVKDFIGDQKHYAVVDFGGSLTSTPEARKIYAESDYIINHRVADAFIVSSLGVRLIANFFINVTKPKVRTKLFSDYEHAEKWLESIIMKQSTAL